MGEELEMNLYFKGSDGKVVPWNGLSDVEIISEGEDITGGKSVYARFLETTEMSFTAQIDKKKSRKFLKWLKTNENKHKRYMRRYYRQKEHYRRWKLKNGGVVHA